MRKIGKTLFLALGCLLILALLAPTAFVADSQADQFMTPVQQIEPEPAEGVAAIPGAKSAQVGPNTIVNDRTDLPGIGQSETSHAVSSDARVIAVGWNDANGFFQPNIGTQGWGASTDSGTSFTDGGGFPAGPQGGLTTSDPAMVVCPDGTFYFNSMFQTGPGLSALAVYRGTPAGPTINWSSPVIVVQSTSNFYDKNYMECGPNGDLYISVTNFVGGGGNGQIEFFRSTDGGATWSAPLVLRPQEGVVNQGSYPAAGPLTSNQVCVAWQRGWLDGDPNDTIEIRCSSDRGASFGPQRTAARFTSNAFTVPPGYNRSRISDFPGIDIDVSNGPNRGTIYVGFQDGDRDVRDVKLTKSTDGGVTWSTPVTINDDAGDGSDEFWPWVKVCEETGQVGVLWYSNNDGITDVYLDESSDGSGGADVRVTDVSTNWPATSSDIIPNFGDYINLQATRDHWHATWADGRFGDPDVFYAKIDKGAAPPPEGDFVTHYTVYSIRDGVGLNQQVEIEDQFARRRIRVGREKVFLVPAIKNPGAGNCAGQICGEFTPCATEPGPNPCFCFKLAEGTPPNDGMCVDDFFCSGAEPCATDADCPSGKACVVESCCGGNPGVCVPTECTGQGPQAGAGSTGAGF
jgi:hypothetical protein